MAVRKLVYLVRYQKSPGTWKRREFSVPAPAARGRAKADDRHALEQAEAFLAAASQAALEHELDRPTLSRITPETWNVDHETPPDANGKRHRKNKRFRTESDAVAYAQSQAVAIMTGTYTEETASAKQVRELYALWIERVSTIGAGGRRPVSPKTADDYRRNYENFIRPYWEFRPVASIRYAEVASWASKLTKPLAQSGSQRQAGLKREPGPELVGDRQREFAADVFSRMLNHAVKIEWIRKNPALDALGRRDYVPAVRPTKTKVRLTIRQLDRLASAAGHHRPMIFFTGATGLRWGEVTALQVKHFDVGPNPTVEIRRSFVEVSGKLQERDGGKTGTVRTVPIPPQVMDELRPLLKERGPDDLVFPSPKNGRPLRNSNFGKYVHRPAGALAGNAIASLQEALGSERETNRGKAIFGHTTRTSLRAFQEQAGLHGDGVVNEATWLALSMRCENARLASILESAAVFRLRYGDQDFDAPDFHSLRHTAVSLAIKGGANVKVVQQIAGHSSAAMTLDTYADFFDDDLHDSARRIGLMMSADLGPDV